MLQLSASQDRRIRKSKTSLKKALIELMHLKPFKEITVTDIVQLADLNRGTFYRHFQYKEDLFNEMTQDVIQDLVASFRKPYQNGDVFNVSQMPSSAIKIFEHVYEHAQFYTLVVKSDALIHFQQMICAVLRDLALQDFSEIFPSHINRELLASYQSHAIFGMIMEWIEQDFRYSPTYMADELLKIIHLHNNPTYKETSQRSLR